MKLAITEKSFPIFNYVKEHEAENITMADIAIGMGKADADDEDAVKAAVKSVNGTLVALQRKGYIQRVEGEIEGVAGTVKFIQLTDEGKAYDHDAAVAHDAEEAANK